MKIWSQMTLKKKKYSLSHSQKHNPYWIQGLYEIASCKVPNKANPAALLICAINMLKQLSGKTHCVVTAVCVVDADTKKTLCDAVSTYVTFNDLSEELIRDYVEIFMPLDKAGAYGIQEMGPEFIKKTQGCLDNVIGLPTQRVKEMLEEFGVI